MYTSMYMHISIYMYTSMYMYASIDIYVCIHAYTCLCRYVLNSGQYTSETHTSIDLYLSHIKRGLELSFVGF
jgi:hypothetical protein